MGGWGWLGLAGLVISYCRLGLGFDWQQLGGRGGVRAENDRSAKRGDSSRLLCGCPKEEGTAVAGRQVAAELD